MNDLYHDFVNSLDQYLAKIVRAGEQLDLYQIGGSAVIMRYGIERATKDFDVLWTEQSSLLDQLADEFGILSAYSKHRHFYLEVVPSGLPNVPEGYRTRCSLVEGGWKHLRLWHLEAHDLIVTKLRRFNAQDRADIRAICDLEQIQPHTLQERLDSALAWYYKDEAYQEAPGKHLASVIQYLEGRAKSI